MNTIDLSLFFALYNLAGHSKTADFFIVFLAEYFIYITLFIYAFIIYRTYRFKPKIETAPYFAAIFSALVARFGVGSLIRFFYHHPRPFITLSLAHLINDNTYSFPSGHTIFMFGLATATYFFNKKLAYFLYASGLAIGLARIAGGVHYPSDILGGIMIGVLTGYAVYKLWQRYFLHKTKYYD